MSNQVENTFQQRIDEITARYKPRLDEIAQKGKQIEDDFSRPSDIGVVIGVDIQVDWKEVDIIFDLPSVIVKDKRIVFDSPEITKNTTKIVFDIPSTRTVLKKYGQYPVTEWDGLKVTVRWKDILVEVPEFYMKRVDIVYDLPSVIMTRKEIVLGIPEFTMQQQKWVIRIPQFTIVNVSAKTEEIKKRGEILEREAQFIAEQMNQEIQAEIAKFNGTAIGEAFTGKNDVSNVFDKTLGDIKSTIDELQAQGCDPIKVPTENGDINLRKIYDEVTSHKEQVLAEFEQGILTITD